MSEPIKVSSGLVVRRCGHMDDWYLIQRAEHEGRQWIEPCGPGMSRFMCSSRISDADVEGTWGEMRALMEAIRGRGEESFKRCAVRVEGEAAFFWSPRNSQREAEVPLAAADAMAAQFLADFPERPTPEGEPQGEERRPLLIGRRYVCPCGGEHSRGPVNGDRAYRCLRCGDVRTVATEDMQPEPQGEESGT